MPFFCCGERRFGPHFSKSRKGQLKAISVVVKVRQGRKASTLVTGCEAFFISPDFMSEELKRICATSTSGRLNILLRFIMGCRPVIKRATVSPVPGKGNAMEVLVQGKQIKAVTDFLVAQGIPKRWIDTADLSEKKK